MTAFAAPTAASTVPSVPTTILVGAIGAAASLLGVFAKSYLDRRVERDKHQFELQRTAARLSLERGDALRAEVRTVAARFLVATHDIYEAVKSVRQGRRAGDLTDDAYRAALRALSVGEAQAITEEIGLLASPRVADSARSLWQHLRSEDFVQGRDTRGESWAQWKERYWLLRGQLVEALKADVSPTEVTG